MDATERNAAGVKSILKQPLEVLLERERKLGGVERFINRIAENEPITVMAPISKVAFMPGTVQADSVRVEMPGISQKAEEMAPLDARDVIKTRLDDLRQTINGVAPPPLQGKIADSPEKKVVSTAKASSLKLKKGFLNSKPASKSRAKSEHLHGKSSNKIENGASGKDVVARETETSLKHLAESDDNLENSGKDGGAGSPVASQGGLAERIDTPVDIEAEARKGGMVHPLEELNEDIPGPSVAAGIFNIQEFIDDSGVETHSEVTDIGKILRATPAAVKHLYGQGPAAPKPPEPPRPGVKSEVSPRGGGMGEVRRKDGRSLDQVLAELERLEKEAELQENEYEKKGGIVGSGWATGFLGRGARGAKEKKKTKITKTPASISFQSEKRFEEKSGENSGELKEGSAEPEEELGSGLHVKRRSVTFNPVVQEREIPGRAVDAENYRKSEEELMQMLKTSMESTKKDRVESIDDMISPDMDWLGGVQECEPAENIKNSKSADERMHSTIEKHTEEQQIMQHPPMSKFKMRRLGLDKDHPI